MNSWAQKRDEILEMQDFQPDTSTTDSILKVQPNLKAYLKINNSAIVNNQGERAFNEKRRAKISKWKKERDQVEESPLSDQTIIAGAPWSKLKKSIMIPDFTDIKKFANISSAYNKVLQRLIDAQIKQGNMQELKIQKSKTVKILVNDQ